MSFDEQFDLLYHGISQSQTALGALSERFRAQIDFSRRFADAFPARRDEWNALIMKSMERVAEETLASGAIDIAGALADAEAILGPIGKVAKEYTIHCVGHAHIDMNWMWPWQETVNVTHDTFYTVDRLMEEFPEFRFSQSQASTYAAMQEYCPEVFEKIAKRVKSGQWEVTASMWVEGDKNLISGESLCRHLLYTRKYMKKTFDLDPEQVSIDWSPDTFGHCGTLPSILTRGGVGRYYFHRTGPDYWLFKWRSPDGSEVIAFKDKDKYAYNGIIDPHDMGQVCADYVRQTGLHDFLYLYGVGDHGGGPTRRDLRKARDLVQWPIFPTVKLSTINAYFDAVEAVKPDLPVIDQEMNFIFEGCYTSQSSIKKATRVSEIALPEVETLALIAGAVDGMDYPHQLIEKNWHRTLFSHFHDILPGSGVHATYEYSSGMFQEIQAAIASIRARALRRLAERVDTSAAALCKPTTFGSGLGDGLGAGAGDPGLPGGVTSYNLGAECAEPLLVYNQKPWVRREMVYAKVWNKEIADDRVVVRDSQGNETKGQVIARGAYWGHNFTQIAFQAEAPAMGYKVYAIDSSSSPVAGEGASIRSGLGEVYGIPWPTGVRQAMLENEFLRVAVDYASGAIVSLVDKETGHDYVPKDKFFGVLEHYLEEPHPMSAWCLGQTPEFSQLTQGGRLVITQRGPNRVSVRTDRKLNDSRISVEVGLNAGSRQIDFNLKTYWVEHGSAETGVPVLRVAFPTNIENGVATYEIPFGTVSREQSWQEVPSLKWADLSGESGAGRYGITLLNNSKYGYSCVHNTVRLTLLRSSYEPDPLPEVSNHEIGFAVVAHSGCQELSAAIRAGEEFNSPMAVSSAPVQSGTLPAEKSFVEAVTPNVFVAAVKKAESGEGVIIRLYEISGKNTTACIRLSEIVKLDSPALETDILERPLPKNTAKMTGDMLTVKVPAYANTTVLIGS